MKTNTKYSGIYEADNGTFYVSSRATTKDGYRIAFCKRGFLTKTEALNYKNIENERIKNSYKFQEQNKNIKFHDFLDMYFKEYSLSVVNTTAHTLYGKINEVIKPNIPNLPMDTLKPRLFAQFRLSIASMNKYVSGTKNAFLSRVKSILESARDKNYLDSQMANLCIQELSPVANDGHNSSTNYWEYEEFQAFISSFEDNDKYIRTHDFRHSNITYLIDKGVDIKLVANQVGHSNTSTTLNVYDHISDKRKEKLKSVLSDIDF